MHIKRNYILGVLNGIFFRIGTTFIDVNTILPVLIQRLTGSATFVGLIASLYKVGWFFPQAVSAYYLQDMPFKKPVYIRASIARVFTLLSMTVLVALANKVSHVTLLCSVVALVATYSALSGFGSVAFMDIIARTVDPMLRATFFSMRWALGGILSIGAGYAAKWVIQHINFPTNYSLLFGLSTTFIALSAAMFALAVEPTSPMPDKKENFREILTGGISLMRNDSAFRNLYLFRVMIAIWSSALPLYIVYARKELGIAESFAGILAAVQIIGRILPNALWSYIGNKFGNKYILITSAFFATPMPFLALFLSEVPDSMKLALLGLIFFSGAAALNGIIVGSLSYMLDIAPEHVRPKYIGVFNTYIAPWMLLPTLAGWFAGNFGYIPLFKLALLSAILALFLSSKLK